MKEIIVGLVVVSALGGNALGRGASNPTPAPMPPIVVAPVPSNQSLEDLIGQSYPSKGWHSNYSIAIGILQKQMPIDSPCKDVEVFLKGIISAESGFDRTQIYQEPAPLNQKSIGLFQLSLTDNSYGCGFQNERDIQNPIKNIACAFKIFAKLKKANSNENIFQYGGRYWSTLRWSKYGKWAGKRQSGVNEVLSYVRKNGCSL